MLVGIDVAVLEVLVARQARAGAQVLVLVQALVGRAVPVVVVKRDALGMSRVDVGLQETVDDARELSALVQQDVFRRECRDRRIPRAARIRDAARQIGRRDAPPEAVGHEVVEQ